MKTNSFGKRKMRMLRGSASDEAANRPPVELASNEPTSTHIKDVERRAAEAIILIADLRSTDEQLSQLDQWRAESAVHQQVFAQFFDKWCGGTDHAGSAIDAAMAYRDFVFTTLLSRVGDPSTANELLKETYRSFLLLNRTPLQHPESIRACLLCLSRSVAAPHARKDHESPDPGERWGLRVDASSIPPQTSYAGLQQSQLALESLQELPRRQREILTLSIAHFHTVKGIAKRLEISRETVLAEMASAVRTIRNVIRAALGVES